MRDDWNYRSLFNAILEQDEMEMIVEKLLLPLVPKMIDRAVKILLNEAMLSMSTTPGQICFYHEGIEGDERHSKLLSEVRHFEDGYGGDEDHVEMLEGWAKVFDEAASICRGVK